MRDWTTTWGRVLRTPYLGRDCGRALAWTIARSAVRRLSAGSDTQGGKGWALGGSSLLISPNFLFAFDYNQSIPRHLPGGGHCLVASEQWVVHLWRNMSSKRTSFSLSKWRTTGEELGGFVTQSRHSTLGLVPFPSSLRCPAPRRTSFFFIYIQNLPPKKGKRGRKKIFKYLFSF